jgi:hypothetical protein
LLKMALKTIIPYLRLDCGVMVSVLASCRVYHEFEHWSGQTNDYEWGMSC